MVNISLLNRAIDKENSDKFCNCFFSSNLQASDLLDREEIIVLRNNRLEICLSETTILN
jgi:hypothetical protein